MFEWPTNVIEKSGYLGVVLGMGFETVFPPLPSELVMIFAGASASTGKLNIFLVILAAGVGSTIGLLPWYFAARLYGKNRLKQLADRYGRILTIEGRNIETAHGWFDRHGKIMVFCGRCIPALRTLVAIPAGVLKMKLKTFLLWAFLGSIAWDGIFAFVGYRLGEKPQLEHFVNISTYIFLGIALAWYIYRVVRFYPHPHGKYTYDP